MADPVEVLPLLVIVVLLMAAGGGSVERMEVVFDGDREATEVDGALVVGGGTVAVPAGETVGGPVYVVGGNLSVRGRIDGDVEQLAGNVTVADGGAVSGELRTIAGRAVVADGAAIGSYTTVEFVQQERSPAEAAGLLAVQALVLALAGGWLARRRPALLENVGDAVARHPVVSGVVGAFTGASALAVVVFMAFTLVLVPVGLLGLAVGVVSVAYGYLAFGWLVGRALPVDRPDLATAVGVTAFVLAESLVGRVPVVGTAVQFALAVTGLGAVLVTYYGVQAFEPALSEFGD